MWYFSWHEVEFYGFYDYHELIYFIEQLLITSRNVLGKCEIEKDE